jgi:anti-sigma factor RsiW
MGCQSLEDLFELYLLGALCPEDRAAVEEHLSRGCPQCGEHLREAALTVYLLCQPEHLARPDPKHKSRFLRRLGKS